MLREETRGPNMYASEVGRVAVAARNATRAAIAEERIILLLFLMFDQLEMKIVKINQDLS